MGETRRTPAEIKGETQLSKPRKKLPRGVYEKVPGSGIYYIRYSDATGNIQRELAGRSLTAAVKLYQKRKTEVLQGKKLPELLRARKVNFRDLLTDMLEYSKRNKLSYADDVQRATVMGEYFGQRIAESITPQEVDRWLASHEWKAATQNRYRALFLLTYRVGTDNGKVNVNPAKLVRQRREDNARIRFLSEQEEYKLREVIANECPHHLPEFEVALNTGMRLSEQYGLTWNNVDFQRRIVSRMAMHVTFRLTTPPSQRWERRTRCQTASRGFS